jgi:O-antigen ligase
MIKQFLIFFLLITAMSKTYVLWAHFLSLSIGNVTAVFFALSLIFVGSELYVSRVSLNRTWHTSLLLLLVIGPFISMYATFNFDIRMVLLQLFYFTCFHIAYMAVLKYGIKFATLIVATSALITILSGVASVFSHHLFLPLTLLAESEQFYWGRAFGFYLQPNSFAIAINIHFIALFFLSKNIKLTLYLYPLFLVSIILAGSRTNMVGFAFISMFFLYYLLKYEHKKFIRVSSFYSIILVIFSLYAVPKFFNSIDGDDFRYLNERITYLSDFISGNMKEGVTEDGSMVDRFEYQLVYLDRILEKPIFGHGFGIQYDMKEAGQIIDSAHNTFLEVLLQGGIVYGLILIGFCIIAIYYVFIFQNQKRLQMAYVSFVFFMFFYFLFSTTFLSERVVYVFIGLIVGTQVCLIKENNND